MKKLLRILLALVALIVVALTVAVLLIDSIAKAAVEKGASYALGVETTVEELDLSLTRGRLTMDGLRIANPPGFSSSHLMRSGRFDLELRTASIFGQTVELRKFEIDGLDVNIEQKLLGSNVSKVLENLKRFETAGDADEAPGKKVRVDRVIVRNVVAHFHLLPALAPAGPITVEVPEIELTGVTSDDAGGVVIGELVRRLIPKLLERIFQQAGGKVPGDFLDDFNTRLDPLIETVAEDAVRGVLERVFGGRDDSPGEDE